MHHDMMQGLDPRSESLNESESLNVGACEKAAASTRVLETARATLFGVARFACLACASCTCTCVCVGGGLYRMYVVYMYVAVRSIASTHRSVLASVHVFCLHVCVEVCMCMPACMRVYA